VRIRARASWQDAAAEQADQLRQYLGRKFRRHEDVRLLLSPVEALTPAFAEALARAGRTDWELANWKVSSGYRPGRGTALTRWGRCRPPFR
jgi:hypothetical protein